MGADGTRGVTAGRATSDLQAAGQVGGEHAAGVELGAEFAELLQPGIHPGEHRGPHPGVLGQVDPASSTSPSSWSSSPARPAVAAGKSSASVQPGIGKDRNPGSAGPNRLSTVTNEGARAPLIRSSARRTTGSWPNGTTNWYWRKPAGPYTRFQFLIPSSGWKNAPMAWISPSRLRGALRYQTSLASPTVTGFGSPPGKPGGAPRRALGRKASGSRRSFGPRSPGAAKSPLVITARPRLAPRARQSVQATV